jgi:hypothetical protein
MLLINYLTIFSLLYGAKTIPKDLDIETVSYTGHKVIRLESNEYNMVLLDDLGADIWSKNSQFIQARVTPKQFKQLKALTGDKALPVVIQDVQKAIDMGDELRASDDGDWFSSYHTYSEILTWFNQLAKENPNHVKLVPSIGKSFEGRDIFAVHLTNPNNVEKKQVWFQSLIHAREWITGTTTQFIFSDLLANRQSESVKSILDKTEIVFIPIVNPDGYVYTRIDRLTRKNRHLINGGDGVDLNRNFPAQWGGPGASKNPNSQTYLGPNAASEPETQALMGYFKGLTNVAGAIDFHSYSELLLRPFSHNETDTPDEAALKKLGDKMVKAIEKVSGKKYSNIKEVELYPCSGSASDFYYGDGSKLASFAFELSPGSKASNGFIVPPSQILEVAKDVMPGVLQFLEFVTYKSLKNNSQSADRQPEVKLPKPHTTF